MDNHKMNSQIKASKKISFLSFRELDLYFTKPDSIIQNMSAISAQQFTKDLDSKIDFSGNKPGLHGNIKKSSIIIDTNTGKKTSPSSLMHFLQENGKLKLKKFLNKIFKYKNQTATKVIIDSWNFTDFDATEKFQVGKLYTIKPIRLTYNITQQEFEYNKQIISEFCIKESNGNIKKLLVVDSIKNGKIKREKYIDGQNIKRQHYHFEIRSHRLNRGLMKTFLFHKLNKNKLFEYQHDSHLRYYNTDQTFAAAQPVAKAACQIKGALVAIQKSTEKFPGEYIKNSVFKVSGKKQKRAHDIAFGLRDQAITTADEYAKIQEISGMKIDSIYTADGYSEDSPNFSVL